MAKRTAKEIEKDCKKLERLPRQQKALKILKEQQIYLMQKLIQLCQNILQFLSGLKNN